MRVRDFLLSKKTRRGGAPRELHFPSTLFFSKNKTRLSPQKKQPTSDRDGLVTLDELAAFGTAAFTAASLSHSQGGGTGSFCDAVRGAAALSAARELSGRGTGGETRGPPFSCPRCDENREDLSHAARERAAAWLLRLVVADDAVRSSVRGEGEGGGGRRRPDSGGGGDGDESKKPSSSSSSSRAPPLPPPPLVHSASLRALLELLAPFDDDVGGCSGGGCSYNHLHHHPSPSPQRRRGKKRQGRSCSASSPSPSEEEEEEERLERQRRRRDRDEEDDRAFAAIFASLKAAARASRKSDKPSSTSKRQNHVNDGGGGLDDNDSDDDDESESDSDGDSSLEDWVPASAVRHLCKGAIDGVARLLGRVCGEEDGGGGGGGEEEGVFGVRRKQNLGDDDNEASLPPPCDLCGGGGGDEGSVARRLWDAAGPQAV